MGTVYWGGFACQFWISVAFGHALRNVDPRRHEHTGAGEDPVPADDDAAADVNSAAQSDAAPGVRGDESRGAPVRLAHADPAAATAADGLS